jgi:hypothetical protein
LVIAIDVTAVVSVRVDTKGTAVDAVVRETMRAGPKVIVIDGFVDEEATITNAYELPLVGRVRSTLPDDERVP